MSRNQSLAKYNYLSGSIVSSNPLLVPKGEVTRHQVHASTAKSCLSISTRNAEMKIPGIESGTRKKCSLEQIFERVSKSLRLQGPRRQAPLLSSVMAECESLPN